MSRNQNGERAAGEQPGRACGEQGERAEAGLIRLFRSARRDRRHAVLEGLHPLKHALRFGASIESMATPDRPALLELARRLAPDVLPRLEHAHEVERDLFARLAPGTARDVIALARRPDMDRRASDAPRAGGSDAARPWVLLEEPSHLGNVGAVVRVCAAADAAGVLTTGRHDPWQPAALRGSAGLHFALPVLGIDDLDAALERVPDRPIIAIDPQGEPLDDSSVLPSGSLLAFGSERRGLSTALLRRAQQRVRIPMRPGVSSLNLATAVAVVLYSALRPSA